MKNRKQKIIFGVSAAAVLLVCSLAFFFFRSAGENAEYNPIESTDAAEVIIPTDNSEIIPSEAEMPPDNKNANGSDTETLTENHMQITSEPDTVTAEQPKTPTDTAEPLTCTLSVRCDTILANLSQLNKEKVGIVPQDGIIYAEQTVTFNEGESVFNLLSREMKKNKIHMEFENTPLYKTAYIEGIANLYEFDCGELSGWMYRVNGVFPSYGCSRYILQPGDKVEWIYTCDLGKDIGSDYAAQKEE